MKKITLFLTLILTITLFNICLAAEEETKPNVIIDNGTGYTKANYDELDRSFNINDYLDEGVDASKDAIDVFFEKEDVKENVGLIRGFINSIKKFFEGIANFFKNLFFKESKEKFKDNISDAVEAKADEKVNDTLSMVEKFAKENLDDASSSYVSSLIENAKNLSDEEKVKNVKEVTDIINGAVNDIKKITEVGNSSKVIDTIQSLLD